MKPYNRLFTEVSLSDRRVQTLEEAKQIVDISKLEWGDDIIDDRGFWYDEALEFVRKHNGGWRLPTIQELYTAYLKQLPIFANTTYWSCSFKDDYQAWGINMTYGRVALYSIKHGLEGSMASRNLPYSRNEICPVREIIKKTV